MSVPEPGRPPGWQSQAQTHTSTSPPPLTLAPLAATDLGHLDMPVNGWGLFLFIVGLAFSVFLPWRGLKQYRRNKRELAQYVELPVLTDAQRLRANEIEGLDLRGAVLVALVGATFSVIFFFNIPFA